MATNPQIAQGTLNRLRASVTIADAPELTVTPPFLGNDGIAISFDGAVTNIIPTMTGTVTSPEPYQQVTVRIPLLKTQSLANAYESRRQSNPLVGDIVVRPDVSTLSPYTVRNGAITSVSELNMGGKNPEYVVTISGYIEISNDLWEA